jgi:D-alanyl-D-alanine carboxypeptidase
MHPTAPPRAGARRTPGSVLVGLAALVAATIGILGHRSVTSPLAAPTVGAPAAGPIAGGPFFPLPPNPPSAPSGVADGVVPRGVSAFDGGIPAVANLDPALRTALRRAATDAARHGVSIEVNSGWRSPGYQQQLLREAVAEYGSEEEAARWVAPAETSAHVSGDAVDIGPAGAATWLSGHGARYGLCPIYGNEPWHFERRVEAVDHGCPALFPDPTHDPRMQR